MTTRGVRAIVWDFFKVLEDEVSKAQCLLYTQSKLVVSRGGICERISLM